MLKEKKKTRIYLIAIAVIVVLILGLIAWRALRAPRSDDLPAETPRPTQQVIVRDRPVEKLVEKLVEVKKEVTAEEIRSGLNDMGVLLTQEYYFTDVLHYSSIKTLFHIELGITESSYLASYDGVVSAGVDFTRISVQKDANGFTVSMPHAEVVAVDIAPESFTLYSEKTGLGNPVSIEDFNASVVELERSAREKALDRGLLDKADENARALIRNFISELTDGAPVVFRYAS